MASHGRNRSSRANPRHRFTTAFTWQLPVGRGHRFLSNAPKAFDLTLGGWQYSAVTRFYSGRQLLFSTSYVVDGDPTLDNPIRDRWFDTSKFKSLQDSFKPRTNPWFYDGLTGPKVFLADMTLTKTFSVTEKKRIEARVEAYNAFNHTTWDIPDLSISSPNFGKVTRKRADGAGREVQLRLRFVF